ncbi:SMP-30/gluconolactonase/LRE family protein [Bowmanella dokdonensis]|uniref:SMP-30/gluconolactonase/LRE family protein n=2 Tax=Bowmanella dokdonensis TaxID=751969 RepID=A0A939IPT4_9ALTE|nr:SMP-30/gluconolactonase/LRE family protein [Bowmanella dokdonensis]
MFAMLCALCAMSTTSLAQSRDLVAEGTFTQGVEGPVADKAGNLYAVNFAEQGTIGRVDAQGNAELFVRLPEGSVGNGLRFNSRGQLLVADYTGHNILLIEMDTRTVSVLAHQLQMHQPNDIAISANDIVYASDPDWANNSGQLWMFSPSGEVTLIESGMGTTNGIEVSTDEQYLYVNESVQRRIWRYRLDKTGVPSGKQLFYQFDDFGLDGMRCDSQGNLYVARYGAGQIAVISPQGEWVKTLTLKGQHPTNLAFGGEQGRTLYVTMQQRGAIEALEAEYPGRAFVLSQ